MTDAAKATTPAAQPVPATQTPATQAPSAEAADVPMTDAPATPESEIDLFGKMTADQRNKALEELKTKVINAQEDTEEHRADKDSLILLQHLVDIDNKEAIKQRDERINALTGQITKNENGTIDMTESIIQSMMQDEMMKPAFNSLDVNKQTVSDVFKTIKEFIPADKKSEISNVFGALLAASNVFADNVAAQGSRLEREMNSSDNTRVAFRNRLRGMNNYNPYAGKSTTAMRFSNIKEAAKKSEAATQKAEAPSAGEQKRSMGWRERLATPVNDPSGALLLERKRAFTNLD